MMLEDFRESLLANFNEFRCALATDVGDWTVKGFIDVYQNIYISKNIGSGGGDKR